ncbi:hypothetical protein AB0G73_32075 [Streptomyces sp. NPDC020719]|uniref:hypothetical protein n=1 Tax=Streptomyces sp. NPDC020719 TaxID=3154896 RepID=UPI0033F4A6F7
MSLASADASLSARSLPPVGLVALVAPYGDDGRHAQSYARLGWESVAVALPDTALPPAHRGADPRGGYRSVLVHHSVRRTAKKLRARGIHSVVAASGLGVDLADRLTRALELPGNEPGTSALRTDRAVQAAALADMGLAAPRSLRTSSLAAALRWAKHADFPAYVVTAADSATPLPGAVCTSTAEISAVWRPQRHAAVDHSGTGDLVIQERISGQQFVVHTVTHPATGEHTISALWAELRTREGVHGRSDLLEQNSVLGRALTVYVRRALEVLGVESGAARCRIAFTHERGPVLLSARAYARTSPADELCEPQAAGTDHIQAAVHTAIAGPVRPATGQRRYVARVSLIAPHSGVVDQRLLRTVTTLPTVTGIAGLPTARTPVVRTVDRATCPGELILAASSRQAVEEDYRAIRAIEAGGLYNRAAS